MVHGRTICNLSVTAAITVLRQHDAYLYCRHCCSTDCAWKATAVVETTALATVIQGSVPTRLQMLWRYASIGLCPCRDRQASAPAGQLPQAFTSCLRAPLYSVCPCGHPGTYIKVDRRDCAWLMPESQGMCGAVTVALMMTIVCMSGERHS
jgi:hypothetical protein